MEEAMFGTKNGGTPMTAEECCGARSPEAFVDWLAEYHGLHAGSRETVKSNLRSAFQSERAVGFVAGKAQAQAAPKVELHLSLFGRSDAKQA